LDKVSAISDHTGCQSAVFSSASRTRQAAHSAFEIPHTVFRRFRTPRSAFRIRLLLGLLIILGFCLAEVRAYSGPPPRRALLVHSYHSSMTWVADITTGVSSVLNLDDANTYLHTEHLDTKHVSDPAYLENLFQLYQRKYQTITFDVVLTADDDAFDFVLQHRDQLFPGVPVVFCGINQALERVASNRAQITGVFEVTDEQETLNLALKFHPSATEMYVLTDSTPSGLATRKRITETCKKLSRSVKVSFLDDLEMTQLEAKLHSLSPDSIVYVGNFTQDRSGRTFSRDELLKHVKAACNVPIYSDALSDVGRGAVGGYVTRGEWHGATAAEMALRILNGTEADAIPLVNQSPNRPVFDYAELTRLGIPRSRLPENATVLNQPYSLYSEHRGWFLGGLLFFVIQTVVTIALVINWMKRRRAEEALRSSVAREQALFDAVPDLVLRLGQYGVFLDFHTLGNDASRFLPCSEFLGKTLEAVFPTEVASQYRALIGRVLSGRSIEQYEYSLSFSGAVRSFEGRMVPCGGSEVVATVRNVTETKRLREQLFQSQKLEAIGQLAGGVAHDFNNLLTAILGYAQLLKMKPGSDRVCEIASTIEDAGERASELTRQLLGFARRGKFLTTPVDLHMLVAEVIRLLSRTLNKNIRIVEQLQSDRAWILGDAGQLQQTVLNLAVNARDAMPTGGVLTLRSYTIELAEHFCERHWGIRPGPYVILEVCDTGCGIPTDIQDRIFEPFFTTKEQGKGTGMGLAMVYGIVRNHGGFIQVESELGRGSTFRVFLPKLAHPVSVPASSETGHPLHGSGCILLVDDEEVVLSAARAMLTMLGYEVIAAGSGREALKQFQKSGPIIDLVLLDVVMPEMGGHECLSELLKLDPAVRVILCSGYGPDRKDEQLSVCGFLQKPYRLQDLSLSVARALNQGPASVPREATSGPLPQFVSSRKG